MARRRHLRYWEDFMKKNSMVISLFVFFIGIGIAIFFVNKWLEKEIAAGSSDKELIKPAKIRQKGNQPIDKSRAVEKRESGLVVEGKEPSQLKKNRQEEKVPVYEEPLKDVILMQ